MGNTDLLLALFILAPATWRLSSLIARENGPADILGWFRYRVGVRSSKLNVPYGENAFAEGLICLWCNSVWIGLAWAVSFAMFGRIVLWLALPFAISALALFLERMIGGKDG